MYQNKCSKCGEEFETKNPKRVICPSCLYPDRKPISLKPYEEVIAPKTEETQPNSFNNQRPQEGHRPEPGNFQRPYQQGGFQRPQGGFNQNQGNYGPRPQGGNFQRPQGDFNRQGGGFQRPPQQGGFQRPQGGFNQNQGNYGPRPQGGNFQRPQGDFNRQGGGFQRPPQQGGFQRPQGGFNQNQGGGFRRPPQQGGFRRPPQGGGRFPQRSGPPRGPKKPLLISKEHVMEIEKLYMPFLPLPNPDVHEIIAAQIQEDPKKVFFGINLIRQKLMLPKVQFTKRKIVVSPEQLKAIESLYAPLLPLPPIGCHKFISKQLKMDEWRVHVGIGIIRKQMELPRWNPDREDAPEEFKLQRQAELAAQAEAATAEPPKEAE